MRSRTVTTTSPTDRLNHVPDPRAYEVLTDRRLSPAAKVVYMLLDALGGGKPLAISQKEVAAELSISREIVSGHLASLHKQGYVALSTYTREDGRVIHTYRTRVQPEEIVEPIVYRKR